MFSSIRNLILVVGCISVHITGTSAAPVGSSTTMATTTATTTTLPAQDFGHIAAPSTMSTATTDAIMASPLASLVAGTNGTMVAQRDIPPNRGPGPWFQCSTNARHLLWERFDVEGQELDDNITGADGEALKHTLGHCGAITAWKFRWMDGEGEHAEKRWYAHGNMPLGVKHCLGKTLSKMTGIKKKCTHSGSVIG